MNVLSSDYYLEAGIGNTCRLGLSGELPFKYGLGEIVMPFWLSPLCLLVSLYYSNTTTTQSCTQLHHTVKTSLFVTAANERPTLAKQIIENCPMQSNANRPMQSNGKQSKALQTAQSKAMQTIQCNAMESNAMQRKAK